MSKKSNNNRPSWWEGTKAFFAGIGGAGKTAGKFASGGAGTFFGVRSMYNLLTGNMEAAIGDAVGATLGLAGYVLLDASDRLSPDAVKQAVIHDLAQRNQNVPVEDIKEAFKLAAATILNEAGETQVGEHKLNETAEWEAAMHELKQGNESPLIELIMEHAPESAKTLASPKAMIKRVEGIGNSAKPSVKKGKPSLSKKTVTASAADEDAAPEQIRLEVPGVGKVEVESVDALKTLFGTINQQINPTTAELVAPPQEPVDDDDVADGEPSDALPRKEAAASKS